MCCRENGLLPFGVIEWFFKHDEKINFKTILEQIRERDKRDQTRTSSPMVAASDAKIFDTSDLSINEAVDKVFGYIQNKI